METTIQANFENIDLAEHAIRKIKSNHTVSQYSLSPTDPKHTFGPKLLAPIYPLNDADRAERTHGNLLPILKLDRNSSQGETILQLTVKNSTKNNVTSQLINLHGHNIKEKGLN